MRRDAKHWYCDKEERRPQLRQDAKTDKPSGPNGLTLKRTMCFRHVLLAVAIAAAW